MLPTALTAFGVKEQIRRLERERAEAVDAGLADDVLFMSDLEADLAAARAAYVALAVTEIATLRAQLGAPLAG